MRKKNLSYLPNPVDRAAAADAMLLHRITGASIAELVATFGCSRATVFRRLAEARRGPLVAQARQVLAERLVVKALAAYDLALDEGSPEAARDVLFGAGVLEEGW